MERPEDPAADDPASEYFLNWQLPDGSVYDFSTPVTSDLTLTACFGERYDFSSDIDIQMEQRDYPYTGSEVSLVYQVVLDGETLTEGEDYEASFTELVNAGSAMLTIDGIGKYKGSRSASYRIEAADMSQVEIKLLQNGKFAFTGQVVDPKFVATYKGVELREGVDYQKQNVNASMVGTHRINVQGLGNFKGSQEVSYEIVAEAVPEDLHVWTLYDKTVIMHPGDKLSSWLLTNHEDAIASISYSTLSDRNMQMPDQKVLLVDEDGTILAQNTGSDTVYARISWKDGSNKTIAMNVEVVSADKPYVTIHLIVPEGGAFIDGTREKIYRSLTDQDAYYTGLEEVEGKIFAGWFTAPEGGSQVGGKGSYRNPDRDVTLYAQWRNKVTIHFDINGGSFTQPSYAEKELSEGESTHLLGGTDYYAYEREGYILEGWCLDAACEGAVLKGAYTPPAGVTDITLYAKWAKGYQLTFDTNGGYFISGANAGKNTVTVLSQEGKAVGAAVPADPVSQEGSFAGWFTEDGRRVTRSFQATKNETVYARWMKEATHTVRFHAGGEYFRYDQADEDDKTVATRKVQDGYAADISVYRSNYECQWYLDPNYTTPYNIDAPVHEDLNLYAKWARRIQINWNGNGGKTLAGKTEGSTTGVEGEAYSFQTVYRDGYAFIGWFTEDGKEITNQTRLEENISVKAIWEQGTRHHVLLDLAGGSLASYQNATEYFVEDGNKLSHVSPPVKEGAAFLGWRTPDGTLYSYLSDIPAITEDMTITAAWTEDYVTLRFHCGESSVYDDFKQEYVDFFTRNFPRGQKAPACAVDVRNPEVMGEQASKGWTKTEGSGEVLNLAETGFAQDTDLYPVWSKYWTVTFNYMGGFSGQSSVSKYTSRIAKGGSINYPGANNMKRRGYQFDGWYTTTDDSGVRYDMPFVPESDLQLYARWIETGITSYTVTFDFQGAGEDVSHSVEEGMKVAKPADPVREGYLFGGWYTDPACTSAYSFLRGVTGDMRLYAKWTADTGEEIKKDVKAADITVSGTYVYNGQAHKPVPQVVLEGKTLQADRDFEIVGYENNVDAGTAKVSVRGIGDYTGEAEASFAVTAKYLHQEMIGFKAGENGAQHRITVRDEELGTVLTEGIDYSLLVEEGERIRVTISGLGNYQGTASQTYDTQEPENPDPEQPENPDPETPENPNPENPMNPAEVPTVVPAAVFGQQLSEISLPGGWKWRNPDALVGAVGEVQAEIYLPATELYQEKTATIRIQVNPRRVTEEMVSLNQTDLFYTGLPVEPEVKLTVDGVILVKDVDYTVSYSNNLHAGTAKLVVTCQGNYGGSFEREYVIAKALPGITVAVGTEVNRTLADGSFDLGATVTGGGELQFATTDASVARVSEEGIVTPVGVGTTTISVIYLGSGDYEAVTSSISVTVTKAPDASRPSGGDSGSSSGSSSSQGVRQNADGSYPYVGQQVAAEFLPENFSGDSIVFNNIRMPAYVDVQSQWQQTADGVWTLVDATGKLAANQWVAAYNPYADLSDGQEAFSWFIFDENGQMRTGWYTDEEGNTYYMNPASDNTRGGMVTGWHQIDGKWYYFNQLSDGTRGKMLKNTITPDGYRLNEDGTWDGIEKQ